MTRSATFKFAYNGRVAFALLPAGVAVVSAGGAPALACTAIGLIVAYILDVSCVGEGALIAVWLTLLADYLCLAFGGNVFNDKTSLGMSLMLSFACGQTLFLLGTWASLQVRDLAEPPFFRKQNHAAVWFRTGSSLELRRPSRDSVGYLRHSACVGGPADSAAPPE